MRRGDKIPAGLGYSTVLADMDFEAYSEAGYVWDETARKWRSVAGVGKKGGLDAVGTAAYCEHPTTEILSLAYDLKDGPGQRLWVPDCPPPTDLFDHIAAGGLIEAQYSIFEYLLWLNVCHRRMGWPALPLDQMRDSMAKACAFCVPAKLSQAAKALGVTELKDPDGKRLLNKFSRPRNPTKRNEHTRIRPESDPVDGPLLYGYNIQDIRAEAAVSARCPDLSPYELRVWKLDQRINARGCQIDMTALGDCIHIVDAATEKYTSELRELTASTVGTIDETEKMREWLAVQGCFIPNIQAETIAAEIPKWPVGSPIRRVMEIRKTLASASVKKLYAIRDRVSSDGRMRAMFMYHKARTGRFTGVGPQPHNMTASHKNTEKLPDAVGHNLSIISSRNLAVVEALLGDPLDAVSGCVRGLYTAAPGYELMCSDYSAIEAVVNAVMAGEMWRILVFREQLVNPNAPDIYEAAAAKLTRTLVEEITRVRLTTEGSHPLRKGIGKTAELASGYQGWIGAWKQFGADDYFNNEDEIRDAILTWRAESPAIVEAWGGQIREYAHRRFRRELYGVEGAAISAILNPGKCYQYRLVSFGVKNDVLYCRLPSGRYIAYHQPRLHSVTDAYSKLPKFGISYMGWNSDYKRGPIGWMRLDVYGGRFWENIVQAVARDILTFAMLGLEDAGYPIVLHVHDETVSEIPIGYGSINEYETTLRRMPTWAQGWPLNAAGGWRGPRFMKN